MNELSEKVPLLKSVRIVFLILQIVVEISLQLILQSDDVIHKLFTKKCILITSYQH